MACAPRLTLRRIIMLVIGIQTALALMELMASASRGVSSGFLGMLIKLSAENRVRLR